MSSRRLPVARVRTWCLLAALSGMLSWLSARQAVPITLTEVLGFATGAACVLLVVDESIWNFPVGLANNVFFLVLFWSARLYGDMALQVVYLVLGVAGWRRWARGAGDGGPLVVTTMRGRERFTTAAFTAAASAGLTWWFVRIGDASPALDALTTVLSLVAQWLLNRKRLENWLFWITADVAYVWLYVARRLYLTALLYAVFVVLCLAGLRRWRAAAAAGAAPAPVLGADAA
ncbi:MAG TPA: nicotinamide riboside transporter PnuC [Vicinamibacteria bacterium]|nr:nicotinamide riboside transporter PnuC [Vicinamibacteria bacterium]